MKFSKNSHKFFYYVLIIIELYFSNFGPFICFSVMIPDAVQCNFDLLMISTYCSKRLEEYNNKIIIKQDFCALSWLITKIILRYTVSKTSKNMLLNFVISQF